MALGPSLIGHSMLNWALAHLEAYRVNLAVLLEPVLATVWVWLFLGEAPPAYVIPGAALVIAALVLEYLPTGRPPAMGKGTGDRGRGTEDRGQGTGDRGQGTGDRGQGTGDRGQTTAHPGAETRAAGNGVAATRS
jgi:hypothetical protein